MAALLPCPFCGAKEGDRSPPVIFDCQEAALDHQGYCWGCGAATKLFATPDEAVAAWNRRASPPSPPAVWSGEDSSSQSQPCGDGAQPILPPAAEPSARNVTKSLRLILELVRDIPSTQAPNAFWDAVNSARAVMAEPDVDWDYLWLPDDPEQGYTDISEAADGLCLGPKDRPAKIWRGVQLSDLWIAPLIIDRDEDGEVHDWEFDIFATEGDATAAQAAAEMKALSLSPGAHDAPRSVSA